MSLIFNDLANWHDSCLVNGKARRGLQFAGKLERRHRQIREFTVPQMPSIRVLGALAAIGAGIALAPTAHADNINPPSYVGLPCSTHFLLTTALSAFTPANCSFPLSNVTATIAPAPSGGLIITLPNFIDDLPLKEIRIQLTAEFFVQDPPVPEISVVGFDDTDGPVTATFRGRVFEACPPCTADGYFYEDWWLEPNPDYETITILFDHLLISPTQIVIDTISTIPEPASLAIFGLGLAGLGFIRRRRAAYAGTGGDK